MPAAPPSAYDAPCQFGVDTHGKEVLVLRSLQRRSDAERASQLAALREMLQMGIISPDDFATSAAEADAAATAAAAETDTKLAGPYKGTNRVVMMEWERPYMEACVDRMGIGPSSVVLEIGFGLGYSASRIQAFRPRRHVIVECNKNVLERARRWQQQQHTLGTVGGAQRQPQQASPLSPLAPPPLPAETEQPVRHGRATEIVPLTWQEFLSRAGRQRVPGATTGESGRGVKCSAAKPGGGGGGGGGGDGGGDGDCEASELPGWPFHCTHVFFDDFPLPIGDKGAQKALAAADSRWGAFISQCALADGVLDPAARTRFSGYLARKLVAASPHARGRSGKGPGPDAASGVALRLHAAAAAAGDCVLVAQTPFVAQVPDNCPYLPPGAATLYIPLIEWLPARRQLRPGGAEAAGPLVVGAGETEGGMAAAAAGDEHAAVAAAEGRVRTRECGGVVVGGDDGGGGDGGAAGRHGRHGGASQAVAPPRKRGRPLLMLPPPKQRAPPEVASQGGRQERQ